MNFQTLASHSRRFARFAGTPLSPFSLQVSNFSSSSPLRSLRPLREPFLKSGEFAAIKPVKFDGIRAALDTSISSLPRRQIARTLAKSTREGFNYA
jgi:hypothetical protein